MTSTSTTNTLREASDTLTVRHIRAAGSQREIGRVLAAAAHEAHGDAAWPRLMDPRIETVRRRWFEVHHPTQLERTLGVADHFGIDPLDTSVALDWLGTYSLPAGCSVAFYPGQGTKDGHGLLSRNFDFPTATLSELLGATPIPNERPLAADPWVVELHPDRGYASVTIGIMDVMGAMDGINEAGLSIALLADNETPDPEPTGSPQVGLAEQQVVRYVLDHCATVDEALDALRIAKHYYFFTPCHYVIADRSGRSVVWEHSPRRNQERVIEPGPAFAGRTVCTNHLLHRWPDPNELPDDSGPMGTAALTYHRWRTLADATHGGAIVDRATIRDQFAQVRFAAPAIGGRTFWHALYDVDDAAVDVSFFLRDSNDTSVYSAPIRFTTGQLGDGSPG
jgi:predicted choloylglycine hydrolase